MPVRAALVSILAGVLLLAGANARANTLSAGGSVTWFQVVQGIPMTRTFAQLGATGIATGTSIAVNLSYPSFSTNFFVPKTANGAPDLAFHITQGGPQAITATAGMANGTPGVMGSVVVRTANHVAMGLNQSMFKVGLNTLVAVPLSNGKAGQFLGTFTVTGALHTITVDFYAWTPGSVMFSGLTTRGVALPNVSALGSFSLNQVGEGQVTLVSPSKISIDGSLLQRRTASFTKLVIVFPEPGTLLLLGASALALGFAALR